MDFLTTEEQLQQCVPYVELTDSEVIYKSYLPSTGAAAPMPFAGNARVRLNDADGKRLYQHNWSEISFNQGETMEGLINLSDIGVAKNDIARIVVQIRPASETQNGLQQRYVWNFNVDFSSADETSAARIINDYGLLATVSGSTVTVTGSVNKDASDVLYLGDITGLVIDWKADLTVTGGSRPSRGVGMINFDNGEFKLTGGTIKLPDSTDTWLEAIYASGNATVTVDGGKVIGNATKETGINAENGTLIIDSGEINIPRGNAIFAKTLTVNGPSVIKNGIAFEGDQSHSMTARAYGHVTTTTDSQVFHDASKADNYEGPRSAATYAAADGAIWDIVEVSSDFTVIPNSVDVTMRAEGSGVINLINTDLKFKGTFEVAQNATLNVGVISGDTSVLTHVEGTAVNYGTINIYGTLTNLDKVTNYGTINNYSGKTLDNRGTLTNDGVINNASAGVINNSGAIDNASGKINNEGEIINSGTIKSDAANYTGSAPTGNPIAPSDDREPSSGGGCDAGYGMGAIGLLLAWIMARKYRKA
jgi:hypothetical protein